MRLIAVISLLLISLLISGGAVLSQVFRLPHDPVDYSLDGDEVTIEGDGERSLHAVGNVRLDFVWDGDPWSLSAGELDLVETMDEDGEPTGQTAYAEGNIEIHGPDITFTAPGAIDVDLIARHMQSDSQDIHIIFPGGDLTTNRLEVTESTDSEGQSVMQVDTAESTIVNYDLSESDIYSGTQSTAQEESVFGSLRFDFSTITMETASTSMEIVDNTPVRLDCPDTTTVTTSTNTLSMPSCALTFNPPTLEGDDGVELSIGEDTRVEAGSLILTYPPEGGMFVRFSGIPADESQTSDLPERVTIHNPAGTFSAACITIEVRQDGTNRIHATGSACFEIPLTSITGGEETVNQEVSGTPDD
jgi:hypothetical protein